MIIVYYKDQNGKIVSHQRFPENIKTYDPYSVVKAFNQREGASVTAHLAELADGSLERYLYDRACDSYGVKKEDLEDAVSAIEEALDFVRSLEIVRAHDDT